MADRIFEAFWDCTYCGNTRIGGLTKTCPSCGNPQGQGIKFYMDEKDKRYLDDEKAKNYGKGADWKCDFCGSYNRYYLTTCKNCGSDKGSSREDYFGKKINPETNSSPEEETRESFGDSTLGQSTNVDYHDSFTYYEKQQSTSEEDDYDFGARSSDRLQKDNSDESVISQKLSLIKERFFSNFGIDSKNMMPILKWIGIGLSVIAFILLLVFIFTPRDYQAVVNSNSWERTITIEDYRWVDDSAWFSAPSGARDVTVRSEIYQYNQVLDHYESVEVQKSREVFDHTEYETHTSYTDNGDGTFSEHTYTTSHDVYRTEYYYETEQVPVYISVPQYENKYYYEIQKWVYNRTEKASGKNDYSPYWPEYSLGELERVSNQTEKYYLILVTLDKNEKEYEVSVPESYLYTYKIGSEIKITVQVGVVVKIDNQEISFN